MRVPTQFFLMILLLLTVGIGLLRAFWQLGDILMTLKKKLEIACYYLNSWLKQKHFTPTSVVPLELFFSVRISPSYWRRSNIWNWSWLQRRHNKFKDYFWSNWSTKKYKIGGTNSIRGWTLTMSICHFFTWTHFSTGSGGELVNCGGHSATSCGECPEGNGYAD